MTVHKSEIKKTINRQKYVHSHIIKAMQILKQDTIFLSHR